MADRRKLQGEIDRCLKKVNEGVETFDDIWTKVHNAANSNQKEKYEADLKKEIKKLQRLRDQIKTWVASNDIKDKSILVSNRKLIETQMERFKIVERETKTKAYSKEGLGAAAKLDPREKEKDEVLSWVSNCIDNLNIQIDQSDAEVESLLARKRKDRDRQDRLEELRRSLERHRFHVNKLETVMRMVDNDAIDLDQVRKIRDDVEYYVESNMEPDFEENEFIYDDLDLDELTAALGAAIAATSPTDGDDILSQPLPPSGDASSNSPSPSPSLVNHSKSVPESEDPRKRHKSLSEESKASSTSSKSSSSSSSASLNSNKVPSTTMTKMNHTNGASGCMPLEGTGMLSNHNTTPPPASSSAHQGQGYAHAAGATHHSAAAADKLLNSDHSGASGTHALLLNSISTSSSSSTSLSHTESSSSSSPSSSSSSSSSQPLSQAPLSSQQPPLLPPPAPSIPSLLSQAPLPPPPLQQHMQQQFNAVQSLTSASNGSAPSSQQPQLMQPQQLPQQPIDGPKMNGPTSSTEAATEQAVESAGLGNQVPASDANVVPPSSLYNSSALSQPSVPSAAELQQQPPAGIGGQGMALPQQPPQPPTTSTIHLNPVLGVAPLGPQPLHKEHRFQLAMMEASFLHLPHPADSERIRTYFPHNPCPTPAYYPQVPPPHSDTVEFFQRLGTETLFFIFYYMEGTKAQYLAAKALKQKSWRFHTKYMMWFQRHEEPKTITEDYEQGTYIYFDYEKWGQRKKEGFTFEYKFLEDRDLN